MLCWVFATAWVRNLSEKIGKGICPECLAGLDDLPFEDLGRFPKWKVSEGLENPWSDDNLSPLLKIPGQAFNQQAIFRKDPFHIFKQTVGGHWVASAIVLFADLGYWSRDGESNQADVLLQTAYKDFHYFVKNEWHGQYVANIKMFTKALLHWPKIKSFPYGRFKGSDCMLMIRWLGTLVQRGCFLSDSNRRPNVSLIDCPLEPWHVPFMTKIKSGCIAAVEFFRILHNQGTWLHATRHALPLTKFNFEFVDSYQGVAQLCHARGLRRFMLEPSIHYFHHYGVDITQQISRGDQWILSPNQDNCEADEDFVGRLSRLSRCVHASTVTLRTLERYKIKAFFTFTNQDWGASGGRPKKRLRARPW